jgi:PKD repeat protein
MNMKKFKKVFILVILFFLLSVNFASAMPAGDSKNDEQTMEDSYFSEEVVKDFSYDPEEPKENPPGNSYPGSSPPQPLGGSTAVDAMGPYGSPSAPYFEGDTVNFGAQIINGSNSDYLFRWDVNDDGIWEKDFPGSVKGDPYFSHKFTDDLIGNAKVEAWDGVTIKTVDGDGNIWNEKYPGSGYIGSNYYCTVGMKFEVSRTITIDDFGACRNYYPYEYFNIRLWDAGQTLLSQVSNPIVANGTWSWFSISPVTIPAGEYVLSAGIRGYYHYSDTNPGPTSDGIINPLSWVYSSSQWSYPHQDMGANPIPFLDLNYSYSYQTPDILEDTTDIHVENLAPTVDAGSDMTGIIGEPVLFNGSFTDPGTDDTHIIHWNFDDGNATSGNLTPTHTYTLTGTYNVTLTVWDDDGGIEIDYLIVTINKNNTVKDQINDLIKSVKDLGLSSGLENSYLVKLNNAIRSYESEHYKTAIKLLEAFINHLKAQRGKKIPEIEADALIDNALNIIDQIRDEM